MAQKIVDISKYMNSDAPQMVLFGKTYTIKNDKETVLKLNALQGKQSEGNTDEQIIELLVGEEGAKEIVDILNKSPNYSNNTKVVMFNLLALATGTEYEVIEARFRKSQQ